MLRSILLLVFLCAASTTFGASVWDKYLDTYPCAGKNRFFLEPDVVAALKSVLGKDWGEYEQHRALSGCSAIARYRSYLFVDISQQHVGGYSSMILFNPASKKAYVFWLKGRVLDWNAVTYGERPIPEEVLDKFQRELNVGWGHVASFIVRNGQLAIVKKPSSPIDP